MTINVIIMKKLLILLLIGVGCSSCQTCKLQSASDKVSPGQTHPQQHHHQQHHDRPVAEWKLNSESKL